MNSVNIIGNIGHDLELNYTGSGKAVLNFNIAVRMYNGDTSWFRVTAWEKLAETITQYCGKGSKVGISGQLQENKFTDKDGNNRSSVEINARSVDFMDSKEKSQGNQGNQQQDNYNPQSNGQQQQNNKQQDSSPFADVDFNDTEDPFASNDDVTDISDDDLPF